MVRLFRQVSLAALVGVGLLGACSSDSEGRAGGLAGSSAGGSSASGGTDGGSTGGSSAGTGTGGSSAGTGTGGSSAGTGTGGAAGAAGAAAGAGFGGDGGLIDCGVPGCGCLPCGSKIYKCGNCLDDDGDGKTDMEDPDCLGPCHNAEDTFYGSIPGQAGPSCTVDCYFDDDSGAGNDDCHWNHECDPLMPEGNACQYNSGANTPGTSGSCAELSAGQSALCEQICAPRVPNGCDCFGCCDLPGGTGNYVWLGAEDSSGNPTCSLGKEHDTAACPPCTPVPACLNTCEHCELCLGKTELPADCTGSGGTGGTGGTGGSGGSTGGTGGTGTGGSGGGCVAPQCPAGVTSCGVDCLPPCPGGYFCATGCCAPLPG